MLLGLLRMLSSDHDIDLDPPDFDVYDSWGAFYAIWGVRHKVSAPVIFWDVYTQDGTMWLRLIYVKQRAEALQGIYVRITPSDENAVADFLRSHMKFIQKQWEPLW